MPFAPGQSGNPSGKKKSEKLFRDALQTAIKRTDGDKTELAKIAKALVDKALTGDVAAINCIADRLDGKPKQDMEIEHTGAVAVESASLSILDNLIAGAAERAAGPASKDSLPN